MRNEEEHRDWPGTGRPEDAHLPDREVEITFDAARDAGREPPMTFDLRAVCGLVWVGAALAGGYGLVRLFATLVGLLAGAPFEGLLAETAAVGVGQLLLFVTGVLAVYWTVERRPRGAVALGFALFALAAVGVVVVGAPLGVAPLAGVVPAARNAERGFFEDISNG